MGGPLFLIGSPVMGPEARALGITRLPAQILIHFRGDGLRELRSPGWHLGLSLSLS